VKNILNGLLLFAILSILASVSVSAMLNATTILLGNVTGYNAGIVVTPVNSSILTGTVTLNFTVNSSPGRANANTIKTVNYTFQPLEGGNSLHFCTNSSITSANVSQCTNNTALFVDGLYNVTIHIANGTGANDSLNSTTFLAGVNISIENFGPKIIITSPGNASAEISTHVINNTVLVNADFLNREMEVNFSLRDNTAAQNRSFFCELHVIKNIGSPTAAVVAGDAALDSFLLNKTVTFSNATNVTFKVPSRSILLNGSNSTFQVKCRNSEARPNSSIYNLSFLQTMVVSDTVLPNNVTSPTFKNSNDIVKTKFEFGDTVTISDCSGTDNTDEDVQYNITIRLPGLTSFTVQNISLSFEDTQALGTYQVNCSASDSNGNINSSLSEFEIIRKVRENERIETEKPKATIIVAPGTTSEVTLSLQGEARLMTEDSAISFTFKGTSHTLKVIDVSSSEVEIEINSDPIKFRMKKGETREVDLDSDGINDMSVTVNTLISKKADIVVNLLTQRSKETTGERKEVTIPSRATREISDINWTLILVVIIIIIVLVLILYYFKNRGSGKVNFNSKDLGGREDITPYQPPAGYKFPGQ